MAGGIELYVEVAFRLIEWPWEEKGPLSLVVQPCEVKARTRRGELKLGVATPTPTSVIVPPSHSSTTSIGFALTITRLAFTELEASRDGASIELGMLLVANPIFLFNEPGFAPGVDIRPTRFDYTFVVPREQWTAVLVATGHSETILMELALSKSGPEPLAPGRQRLADAVKARNDGSYAEAMRRCRIALDEVQKAGFGGKAPAEVAQFLQAKAGTMSQAERLSALRVALQLFLAPTHHANAPDEHYTREDAELGIAMTAALLRLAAVRLPTPDADGEPARPSGGETRIAQRDESTAAKVRQPKGQRLPVGRGRAVVGAGSLVENEMGSGGKSGGGKVSGGKGGTQGTRGGSSQKGGGGGKTSGPGSAGGNYPSTTGKPSGPGRGNRPR